MLNSSTIEAPSAVAPLMPQTRYRQTQVTTPGHTARPGRDACGWQLAAARAMRIEPRADGALRVLQGRLWITVDAPGRGPAHQLGDHFVDAGQTFELRAGRRAVIEPSGAAPCARVAWEPAEAGAPQQQQQALADLRAAAALAADALRRWLIAGAARRSGCC